MCHVGKTSRQTGSGLPEHGANDIVMGIHRGPPAAYWRPTHCHWVCEDVVLRQAAGASDDSLQARWQKTSTVVLETNLVMEESV
jgi:hypothetical protein